MKNITVSVDPETHHAARVEAARRHTSVSALVRKFLTAEPLAPTCIRSADCSP
jgi:hypothetical protein